MIYIFRFIYSFFVGVFVMLTIDYFDINKVGCFVLGMLCCCITERIAWYCAEKKERGRR